MQIGTSRADQIHLSIHLFWNTVLRNWVVGIQRFGRYGLCSFETSGSDYVRTQCRTEEHLNLHDPLPLRCLVDLRPQLSEHLEVETALTSSVAQSARK